MTSGGLAAVSSSAFAALYSAFGKYDVVHIHAEGPAFFAWLPKMFGKRVVVTVHGIDFLNIKANLAEIFQHTGKKLTIVDKAYQYSKFVVDCFVGQPAVEKVHKSGFLIWGSSESTTINVAGVIIIVLIVIAIIWNRESLRQRGVRLIAINDGVDSARGDDDFTPFRNIMNEYYARDTSRKIRSTFQSKGKSGKHLTGTVIYGYLWNEARDQWLVDPEAAEVVKRIFAMTIEGYGPYQIASKLKEEKVLIPSAYLARHGEGVNKNKTFKDVYHSSPY